MITHFTILFIVLFLNILPLKKNRKKTITLPLSFIIIGVYLAVRYNYGPDYFSYMHMFYSDIETMKRGTGEVLFIQFMRLFDKYYIFIIAHTVLLVFTLYFFTKNYIDKKYYILFFFIFLATNSMMFQMISALRNTMAAMILWWGIHFFYFKRKNILLFISTVVLASLFHTSAIIFTIIPLFELIYKKVRYEILFVSLIISLLFSMFLTTFLYKTIFSSIQLLSNYGGYVESGVISDANFKGLIFRMLNFFPLFFILKHLKNAKGIFFYAGMITVFYFFILFLGLDFHGRATIYLYLFYIISSSYALMHEKKYINKLKIVLPMLAYSMISLYSLYSAMFEYQFTRYTDGNYLWYQTIFSIPYLP